MTVVMILAVLLFGALVAWAMERHGWQWPRRIALIAVATGLLLALPLLQADAPWFDEIQLRWIPRFGITWHLGVDGLSAPLILLALFLGMVAVGTAWSQRDRSGFFFFNLLASTAGVVGVFAALDLFLFFVFWELMLLPMVLLIALWGHEQSGRAATKFFLFTQAGSLVLLAAIVALALVTAQGNTLSFDLGDLAHHNAGAAAPWIFFGLVAAFAVKLPAVPLHTWLPDAHTQAPTAASVLLAGILLKTGAYGIARIAVPLFPDEVVMVAPAIMAVGVVGILWGALLAFAQDDLKRMVAYTSVSHMGFVLLALFAGNVVARNGALMQMLAHGLATGALFVIAGAVQQRLHTRDLRAMGGLTAQAPRLAAFGMFFAVASLGLPGLANFVGEFLILLGTFRTSPWFAAGAALGLIVAAVYALSLVQRAFHGPPATPPLRDLDGREVMLMGVLAVALFVLGVYPQPLFDRAAPAWAAMAGE